MLHVIDQLLAPWQYDFMRHAWMAGTLAAVLASVVGFFVIARQLGFAAHALGHVAFAGATGAVLLGWLPMVGQLLVTLLAGATMGALGRRLEDKETTVGITLALALGVGVLFLHFYRSYSGQASSILWGDLLGVSTQALHWMAWLTGLAIVCLAVISRPLWFASLAPALAEARSLSLTTLSILFFCIMAIATTLASQVVGVFLVFTLVIGPPAIAAQHTRSFWTGIGLSCLIGVVVVWVAILLAYYTDWPISFWISGLVFVLYLIGLMRRSSR